jgi:hypothetical protein
VKKADETLHCVIQKLCSYVQLLLQALVKLAGPAWGVTAAPNLSLAQLPLHDHDLRPLDQPQSEYSPTVRFSCLTRLPAESRLQ